MSHEKEHGKLGWNCGDVLRVRLDLDGMSVAERAQAALQLREMAASLAA